MPYESNELQSHAESGARDYNIDFENLGTKSHLDDTPYGRILKASIQDSKGVLITNSFVSDMNNDFITNLGRKKRFIIPPNEESHNQVKLLQTARASFRAELNKYNVVEEKKVLKADSSQIGQDTLKIGRASCRERV